MSHCKNKESRLIKKWNIIHLYGDSCKYKKRTTRQDDRIVLSYKLIFQIKFFLFCILHRFCTDVVT